MTRDEPQLFGPGDHYWDEFGSTLSVALTGGAFVLQVMHPTIATGVDRHSTFRSDPLGRAVRSFDSVQMWVYGGAAAAEEGRRLRRMHAQIRGVDEHGATYSALEPEAYGWVHATAFSTFVQIHPYVHGRPMASDEQERLYAEQLRLGALLQVPASQLPPTVADFWTYYDTMVRERLQRTTVAEELLALASAPPLPLVPTLLDPLTLPARRALGETLRLLILAGLPPEAREILGVTWTRAHETAVRAAMSVAAPVHRRLPEQLRYLPLALHARRHAREVEAIRRRAIPAAPAARPSVVATTTAEVAA